LEFGKKRGARRNPNTREEEKAYLAKSAMAGKLDIGGSMGVGRTSLITWS